MNLHQLELFLAVAEHGSVTRAAEAHHLSQPAVTARMHDLERSLRQQLFIRVGRRIRLTWEGEELRAHATIILQHVAAAERAMAEIDGLQRGSLRVVATTTVGSYVLPGVLGRFHRAYPGITLALDVTNWSRAVDLLRHYHADLAVLGPTDDLGDMTVRNLMANELVIAADPAHPLAGRHAIPFAEVAEYPVLVREQGSGTRADTERLYAEHGLRPRIAMELRHSTAIKQGVAAGLGVALLSTRAIRLELAGGMLVTLDVAGLPVRRDWHVVYPRDRTPPRAVRAFTDLLLAFAAEQP